MIKKKNMIKIIPILLLVLLVGCSKGGTTGAVVQGNALSGQLLEMDPNRAMAGMPCHAMGGQLMGDCETREIQLETFKYGWSEPTITVKSGELVRIKAISTDVAHGMAIPSIGFNMFIEPGKTTVAEFIAPTPGEYQYGCSVMCGPGHHNHRGKLIVV